ncbi:MAG: KpsF/GutQ family sugar-phosphate isomerase [Rhizomicrobium sp.]|jgi:arabinose-5-phosphate isomerase
MHVIRPAAEDTGPEMAAGPGSDLKIAGRVFALAADAISSLDKALNSKFSDAIDLILGLQGRVIVSGMGKSGHIARKIAATLASTGTPAHFIHPGEASHGDMGAVTQSDGLIILSNSGDTRELSDLITFAKKHNIPLIGIARRDDSALIRESDIPLVLPNTPEACPFLLAPTTSTTLMLVLGDALAIALMERRNFTPDDYREFHPGGSLGKSLLRVGDLMHGGDEMPIVSQDAGMQELLKVMSEKRFGCVGVVDPQGSLVGIFTHGDLSRRIERDLLDRTAAEVMTQHPKIVSPAQFATEAIALMNQKEITVLFVVKANDPRNTPVGIIHMHDCLRAGLQ